MITFKIIPDYNIENRTQIIARAFHEMYTPPRDRIKLSLRGLEYEEPDRAYFDLVFIPGNVSFYLSVEDKWSKFIETKIKSVWNRSAISQATVPEVKGDICEVRYRKANIFSLKTGRQDYDPLNSMFAVLHDLKDGMVRVSYVFEPINRYDWARAAQSDYKKYHDGEMPRRITITREDVFQQAFKFIEMAFEYYIELRLMIIESLLFFMGREEPKQTKFDLLLKRIDPEVERKNFEGGLTNATIRKLTAPTFNTWIRIVGDELNMRTIANAFKDLNSDNEMQTVQVSKKRVQYVNGFRVNIRFDHDVMSDEEVAKLIQLPGAMLQEEYGIENISRRETEVGEILTAEGIHIGVVKFREKNVPVYLPVSNWDELCLPHIVIGGMGTGKTMGYGANFACQSVLNNFGCLVIDPAKGEMGDEIRAGLPADKVHRITLGTMPMSLDWCEVKHSPRAKNRLANTILSFFNTQTEEAGAQTARYLRAVVLAMQTGKLSEIIRILEDEKYRKELLEKMPDGINKITLESLGDMSDARKNQVLSPIYNRLDTILGETYLSECMESNHSLDMVRLMSQRKAIIIDVPKSELGAEAVDLIVNLLSTKIDLAMTLRKEQFPFFVIFDEPHQFLKSGKVWKSAAVESRKWRVGYVWMFHSWEQIPRQLAEIIKAAGPHYHLYRSSKHTYRELQEELYPYSVEDCLKTPMYHAINIIQAGGITQKPFMAQMAAPPSKRRVVA